MNSKLKQFKEHLRDGALEIHIHSNTYVNPHMDHSWYVGIKRVDLHKNIYVVKYKDGFVAKFRIKPEKEFIKRLRKL